ncbi:uncharacterized protein LOC133530259 [Cydia pomonella]|uniref:uncharacterized protein LOC133530259 n=1 Tax=Cydia pomonella TaxID=82600 RepID=UPI002ADDA798|nr:uncharacterized protein LOC133530259 [Cydia pomonella]
MAMSIHNNIVYGLEERQIPVHLSYSEFLFDQLKKGGDEVALDALILGINDASRGIDDDKNDIVTLKMQDTRSKTTRSSVIRDEDINIFKNNPKNIVLATDTIITAKSHDDVHHASLASHQQHQSLYTDLQPDSRDPPVYTEHCSPEKIKIETFAKSSSTLHYLYYIFVILSLSTTNVHCREIVDRPQSALGVTYSQPIQLLRSVTIANSPNMSNVNFVSHNGPSGTRSVTIINSPNMSNVNFIFNDGPGATITVRITNCANMSNVAFIFNAAAGSITATLTNCAGMSHVTFVFNAAPGGRITDTVINLPNMSNATYIYN